MIRRRAAVGGLFAGALLAPRGAALASLLKVERRPSETFTLSNGLQVIVLPSRRAPIVTQVLVYKVGSAEETFGQTGIAHFLEHMMFKGTASLPSAEFSRTIARHGGRDNAFTSFDITGYHQTIAADRLELVMRMEADRMANLRIVEKEVVPERQVILEERRMRVDNVPAELLDEAVREQLFGRHKAYAMPTSGYPDDIKRLGIAELVPFYRRFYAPNNAVLIDTYAQKAALRLGVAPESVRSEFKKRRPVAQHDEGEPRFEDVAEAPIVPPSPHEAQLLKLLLAAEEHAAFARTHLQAQWIKQPVVARIVTKRLEGQGGATFQGSAFFAEFQDDAPAQALLSELLADEYAIPNADKQLADVLTHLRNDFLTRELQALTRQLTHPETPEEERIELMRRQQELRASKRQPLA